MHRAIRLILAVTGVVVLAGCAVGPDFHRPDFTSGRAYTSTDLPGTTVAAPVVGGSSQTFSLGQEIPEQWWTLFHSGALDKVIRAAFANSPTLAAAQAALREAKENLNARAGGEYSPGVDASFSTTRQKTSPAAFGQPDGKSNIFDLHHASVNVSYVFDIFGGGRRELEALRAQVNYQDFQLKAAYLTLASNIVTTAVTEASLREQLQALREILKSQEQQLAMLEKQLALGGVSRPDVLAQRAQVEQTRATLPPLEKELARTRHQLTLLAGEFPDKAGTFPEFDLDAIKLPQDLPVSLPSSLAEQRPDIRAAEEILHSAGAGVGVATANLYPQVTLSGSYGSQAGQLGHLADADSTVWSLGAGVLQPVFNGGMLRAKRLAAIAVYNQAVSQYRQTVLVAFQNVADVLRALELDAVTLKAQADAELAARDSLELSRKQFEAGALNYTALFNAERQFQQARISLIQAQAARFTDTAALFQALGGGWWNSEASTTVERGRNN
jgi:NodT family efflux transporter outer membrane factor (OMF) lipoprotein